MKHLLLLALLPLFTACAPRAQDIQYSIVDNPCSKFINVGDHDLCMYEFKYGVQL